MAAYRSRFRMLTHERGGGPRSHMEVPGALGYALPHMTAPLPNAFRTSAVRGVAMALALLAFLVPERAQALSLSEAVEKALAGNERPAILKERRDAAQARIDAARTRWRPGVSLSGDYSRRAHELSRTVGGVTSAVQDRDELVGTTRFQVPIFDPSATLLLGRARLLAEGAQLDLDDERRLLVRDVTHAFLLALSAEQVHQAAERRREYAEQALGDAQARADAGLASINDVTKVQLELSTAARETTRARASREDALLALAFLMADDVELPLEPPEALLAAAGLPLPGHERLGEAAVERRLDLQSRRKLADAWDAFADEPSRRFLPSLRLTGTHELFLDEKDANGNAQDWTVGVGVTWDIFDAGLRAAERRERRAQASEAELEADVVERAVVSEVRRARVEILSAQDSVKDALLAVEASRRNAEETFELYRQGLRTALEVADAGNRAFDADVSLTRERLALTLAWVDLQVALGSHPLSPEPLP